MRRGDEDALAQLYDDLAPLVYSLALDALGDPILAEDVSREVFVRAWRESPYCDPADTATPCWLLRVVGELTGHSDGLEPLHDVERCAILLTSHGGHRCSEAAAILGVDPGTLHTRITAGLRRLSAHPAAVSHQPKRLPK